MDGDSLPPCRCDLLGHPLPFGEITRPMPQDHVNEILRHCTTRVDKISGAEAAVPRVPIQRLGQFDAASQGVHVGADACSNLVPDAVFDIPLPCATRFHLAKPSL